MAINSQHVAGFAAGLGLSALGFYFYKQNQGMVDQFLTEHGIQVSSLVDRDPKTMTLKDLIKAKEELEDIIAEKEYETDQSEEKKDEKQEE